MSGKYKYPTIKPVAVRWIDSMASSGWGAGCGARLECVTIGHLISRDKERVCLAMNRSHYSDGDIMEIPVVAVKSVKRLKE
jgi:hypothetical protein